jgi:hypothetical protein
VSASCNTSLLGLALLLFGPSWLAAGASPEETAGHSTPSGDARVRQLPTPMLEGHLHALPGLVQGLADSDPAMRARCAFLIGQIACRDSAEALAGLQHDPDRTVRIFAGISLAWLGDERGLPAARAALVGTRWWVRYYAVAALWRLGSERAGAAIATAVNDPDELVRRLAQYATEGTLAPWPANRHPIEAPQPVQAERFILDAANYLVQESDWWFHLGDYEQSLRCSEAGAFLDPTFVELFDVSGWLYWSLGRNAEALGAYRRGIQANPDSWQAFFSLGYHYFNLRRFSDSLPYLARACDLGAPPVLAHTYAHALEKAGRLEDSLRQWQHLADLEPTSYVPTLHIDRLKRLLE